MQSFSNDNCKRIFSSYLLQLSLIALAAILGYANSFTVPFVFDDVPNIVENRAIQDLNNFLDLERLSNLIGHSPALQTNIKTRYFGFLSFALNYRIHGLAIWGYHLTNLIIHIVNGWLVFALAKQLLVAPLSSNPLPLSKSSALREKYTPLFAGLLFVSHPIQTEAVTYVIQRLASLSTLLMLTAILCYLKGYYTGNPTSALAWRSFSFGSAALAILTKEFAITTPLILLLWEAVFTDDSLHAKARRLWFFVFIAPVPFLMAFGSKLLKFDFSGIWNFLDTNLAGPDLNHFDYLFTQMRVFLTYLRLLFWPANQNLDYQYPIYRSLLHPEVAVGGLLVIALTIAGFILIKKAGSQPTLPAHRLRLTAFLVWVFILVLLPESSILPIKDVIFEHRLYAPSAWFFILSAFLFLSLLSNLFSKWHYRSTFTMLICFGLVSALTIATFSRNEVWQDALTLWRDVVNKSPQKARPRQILANTLNNLGRYDEALIEVEAGLKFNPEHPSLLQTLSDTYRGLGRIEEAIQANQIVLRLKPDDISLLSNLATLYAKGGKLESAEQTLRLARDLDPSRAETHFNLAKVYSLKGDLLKEEKSYLDALRLNNDYYEAHYNLGLLYDNIGKLSLAENHYRNTIRINPNFISAYNNMAVLLSKQQRYLEAKEWLSRAMKISPENTNVRRNLQILSRY